MTWRDEPAHGQVKRVGDLTVRRGGLTIREELAARLFSAMTTDMREECTGVSLACDLADRLCTEFERRGWRKGDEND